MTSLLFNACLFVLDAVVLRWLRREPGPRRAISGLVGLGCSAALLGAVFAKIFGEREFGTLRFHAWAIFAHGPLVLVAMAQLLGEAPRWRLAGRILAALVVLIAIDAFWVEPYRLEVSHFEIHTAKLNEPLRIALIADVQTDSVGEHERRALELAMAEAPDLVLFAGDYVQVHPARRERLDVERQKLRDTLHEIGLEAPLGSFAVEGNCDPPGWPRIFEGLDVHVFESGGRVETGEVVVTGLDFRDSVRRGLVVPAEERFHIVLGHAPDFALEEVDADLLVAGHCHGGQVTIPGLGPFVLLSRIPRSWATGAHEVRPGTTLVVSRGIGLERAYAPQLRFFCRPQVVIIDLVPSVGG